MTHYAIIEQAGIHKIGSQSDIYDNDVTGHVCVYKRTYRLGHEFDKCVKDACAALSGFAEDFPKVLVISAHGQAFSGDLEIRGKKVDGDEVSIALWQHINAFQSIPNETVVHLSSCFGAYPNALAIQDASQSAPPIIGPLVNISFGDALALHTALLNYINERGIGDTELCEFVDQQQKRLSIHDPYCGRYVIGLIDRTGRQHPQDAVGNQLAANVEPSRIIFEVASVDYWALDVELDSVTGRPTNRVKYVRRDFATGFWLTVHSGGQHKRLRASLGQLGNFIENTEYEGLCGKQFSALYQVAGVYGDDVWAELLEPRPLYSRASNL
jgi:hypothetical protein